MSYLVIVEQPAISIFNLKLAYAFPNWDMVVCLCGDRRARTVSIHSWTSNLLSIWSRSVWNHCEVLGSAVTGLGDGHDRDGTVCFCFISLVTWHASTIRSVLSLMDILSVKDISREDVPTGIHHTTNDTAEGSTSRLPLNRSNDTHGHVNDNMNSRSSTSTIHAGDKSSDPEQVTTNPDEDGSTTIYASSRTIFFLIFSNIIPLDWLYWKWQTRSEAVFKKQEMGHHDRRLRILSPSVDQHLLVCSRIPIHGSWFRLHPFPSCNRT